MTRLAIVGTGISGLGCAHFLRSQYDITLFETARHVGGHSNTVDVIEPVTGKKCPLDTGFMVFNKVTYPHLTRLFEVLDVPIKRTEMSFSVRHAGTGLEFAGSSVNHLFAQRKNLLNFRFYRMLAAVNRFNREAVQALTDPANETKTLGEYVKERGYGEDFFNLYLVPMSSAVWSTPPHLMLSFPAASLLRFFHNHGFLGLHTQHPWYTVDGGSRVYVKRLTAPWRDRIVLGDGVARVERVNRKVWITTKSGASLSFDHVILACHADQALALLADPSEDERRILGEFRYQPNTATVHTDAAVMPKTKLAWSAWNYEINRDANGQVSTATHYWMNALQGVSERENYFVSINRPEAVDPQKVIQRIEYEHPLFSVGALQAQKELPRLNRSAIHASETYFAGSYFRYGFHEDGLLSAVSLAELLLARDPWNS